MKKWIPVAQPDIGAKELKYVTDALKSGWVSSTGHYLEKFESEFSRYCQRKYAQAVSNGTTALHLALLALNIRKGDEVLVPNFTFIAIANTVTYVGATVTLIDCEKNTFNIDPDAIEKKITKKTRAIIVVHTYGHSADMDKITAIARKHKLYVIEDAAEAHGSFYKGKPCGSFGDISCFSFYGNKMVTTGEGGMCLTNDEHLYKKIKALRGQAMSETRRYWHPIIGYNYRLTNVQAAIGCAQLERIDTFLKDKRRNAALYMKLLAKNPYIILPTEKSYATSNFWMFTILLSEKFVTYSRDQVIEKLKEKGIETRNTFYPLSDLPPYRQNSADLLISKSVAYRGITLPSSTKLSRKDIRTVCDILKKILS